MNGTLRGFGMTFDVASGTVRNWYIDREGALRWADNDQLVQPEPPTRDGDGGRDPTPTPEGGG